MLEKEPRHTGEKVDNSYFREVFSRIEQAIPDYRVIGSAAVAAYLGKDSDVKVRDIDVICFPENPGDVRKLQSELDRRYEEAPNALRIDLSAVSQGNESDAGTVNRLTAIWPSSLVNIGRDNNGGYYLFYNGLREPIGEKVMRPVSLLFKGVPIITVPPETLLHLYITRGGFLKPKDNGKVRTLARYVRDYPTEELTHHDFRVFHEFAARMKSAHPSQTTLYRLVAQIDHLFGGRISTNYWIARTIRKFSS